MTNGSAWRPGRIIASTLLTAVMPGLGHLVLKRWRAAAAWAAAMGLTLVIGWHVLSVETLGDLVDPSVIRRGLLISLVVAVVRVAAIVDVLWITSAFTNRAAMAFGSLVLLLAMLPHLYTQIQGERTASALETVFAPVTTSTPTTQAVAVADTSPASTTVDQSGEEAPSTTTSSTVSPFALARPIAEGEDPAESIRYFSQREEVALGEDGRFTVLLLGSDEGPGRGGVRTDSMIVVTIDPWSLRTSLFSIPRNWAQVPMPPEWPGPDTHSGISNTIYKYGWTNAETLFPEAADPGAETLKRVFGDLLQLEIDHYWKVSMGGFVDIVDAFGGVDLDVQLPIDNEFSHPSGGWYYVKLNTGEQELNGLEALAYSRSRRTTSDYNRMGRQRCVVAALGQQIGPTDLVFAFDDVVDVFERHISTDISLSTVPALVDVATLINLEDITTVTFVPPTFVDGTDETGKWKPHIGRIRQAVFESLTGAAGDTELVDFVEEAC